MDELDRWLSATGLDQLGPVFRSNDIDLGILPDLTDAELEKLGVSLGLRKRLSQRRSST
jgi:hypothetical protein